MAITTTQAATVASSGIAADHSHSHVDWAAIFAGAFVAAAIAYVLTTFGSAIGLSMTSPFADRGASTPLLLVTIGLWILWVSASSYMAGGYVSGRMRRRAFDATEHEVDVRDAIHGLVVWAVGSLVGAMLIATTAAGITKTGVQATASVAAGAAKGAGAAAGEMTGQASDPFGYVVDRILRPGAQGPSAQANGAAAAADTSAEVAAIVRRGIAEGDVPADDRAYLAQVVARNTGLSETEARARVDTGINDAKAAAQKAREAADKARKIAIVAAFVLAASLLVGAAAAAWGAGLGGRHRDQGTIFATWFPRR